MDPSQYSMSSVIHSSPTCPRFRLARTVNLRHAPELHFHYDDSMDRGERIDALLRDGNT